MPITYSIGLSIGLCMKIKKIDGYSLGRGDKIKILSKIAITLLNPIEHLMKCQISSLNVEK